MRRIYYPLECISVQFELPVDNPVDNVRISRAKRGLRIYAPINLPDIHNLTLLQLVRLAKPVELSTVFTPLNNIVVLSKESPIIKDCV